MSAEDIFRGAVVISATGTPSDDICPNVAEEVLVHLADEVYAVLREGAGHRQVEASYITPSDEQRLISVTISPVPAADGTLLGAACLINDLSEFERIRQQQELHGEISAEMALDLRTSLTSISGLAQQLAENCDPEFARQLAADIASEAARLDRSIGGFLTEKRTLKSAAAAAGTGERHENLTAGTQGQEGFGKEFRTKFRTRV
jgi:signal transduction histidine kinase